jgi:predicted transcriptional regulator
MDRKAQAAAAFRKTKHGAFIRQVLDDHLDQYLGGVITNPADQPTHVTVELSAELAKAVSRIARSLDQTVPVLLNEMIEHALAAFVARAVEQLQDLRRIPEQPSLPPPCGRHLETEEE